MAIHFGVNLRESECGFNISRERYAMSDNKSSFGLGQTYSDEWCQKHLEDCLMNFDLNMKYFSSLAKDEFNNALNVFLKENNKFIEVYDLSKYAYIQGYYILVLDEFCQIYIGTTKDIKRRVMAHWSNIKKFDRLIFGSINNSIISIDSFRAFDTKRIFVYPTSKTFSEENIFINKFPSMFLLNRTVGGKLSDGLIDAVANGKTRDISLIKPKRYFSLQLKDICIKLIYKWSNFFKSQDKEKACK